MIRESDGRRNPTEELQSCFHLSSIGTVSYALAVCINSDVDSSTTRCQGDCDFYLQALQPTMASFTPPGFLSSPTTAVRGNMSPRNDGAEGAEVLLFGYSNIKRSVRHSLSDLLAAKARATGALTIPDASGHHQTSDKRERLLRIVRGQGTPEDHAASKPFARKRRQMEVALEQREGAYRLEQVVSLGVGRMTAKERAFGR